MSGPLQQRLLDALKPANLLESMNKTLEPARNYLKDEAAAFLGNIGVKDKNTLTDRQKLYAKGQKVGAGILGAAGAAKLGAAAALRNPVTKAVANGKKIAARDLYNLGTVGPQAIARGAKVVSTTPGQVVRGAVASIPIVAAAGPVVKDMYKRGVQPVLTDIGNTARKGAEEMGLVEKPPKPEAPKKAAPVVAPSERKSHIDQPVKQPGTQSAPRNTSSGSGGSRLDQMVKSPTYAGGGEVKGKVGYYGGKLVTSSTDAARLTDAELNAIVNSNDVDSQSMAAKEIAKAEIAKRQSSRARTQRGYDNARDVMSRLRPSVGQGAERPLGFSMYPQDPAKQPTPETKDPEKKDPANNTGDTGTPTTDPEKKDPANNTGDTGTPTTDPEKKEEPTPQQQTPAAPQGGGDKWQKGFLELYKRLPAATRNNPVFNRWVLQVKEAGAYEAAFEDLAKRGQYDSKPQWTAWLASIRGHTGVGPGVDTRSTGQKVGDAWKTYQMGRAQAKARTAQEKADKKDPNKVLNDANIRASQVGDKLWDPKKKKFVTITNEMWELANKAGKEPAVKSPFGFNLGFQNVQSKAGQPEAQTTRVAELGNLWNPAGLGKQWAEGGYVQSLDEGGYVENSNMGVANARPGDKIKRKDGTPITLTESDIRYARAKLKEQGIEFDDKGGSERKAVVSAGDTVGEATGGGKAKREANERIANMEEGTILNPEAPVSAQTPVTKNDINNAKRAVNKDPFKYMLTTPEATKKREAEEAERDRLDSVMKDINAHLLDAYKNGALAGLPKVGPESYLPQFEKAPNTYAQELLSKSSAMDAMGQQLREESAAMAPAPKKGLEVILMPLEGIGFKLTPGAVKGADVSLGATGKSVANAAIINYNIIRDDLIRARDAAVKSNREQRANTAQNQAGLDATIAQVDATSAELEAFFSAMEEEGLTYDKLADADREKLSKLIEANVKALSNLADVQKALGLDVWTKWGSVVSSAPGPEGKGGLTVGAPEQQPEYNASDYREAAKELGDKTYSFSLSDNRVKRLIEGIKFGSRFN